MRIFLFVVTISVVSAWSFAQGISPIQLKQDQAAYTPKTFYISDVTDSLPGLDSIGSVAEGGKKQPLTMKGGVVAAFKNFMEQNLKQNNTTQQVIMNITKLDIDIKNRGTSHTVNASMSITFYAGGVKLIQYSGKGSANTDADPADYAEQFIRKTVEKDLENFDGWWAEHKNGIAVSDVVKVNLIIAKTIDQKDCFVYSLDKPLKISDFMGPPQDEVKELAATFSGIKFSTTGETEKGELVINVTLTPYFDKTKSWFKEAGKNPVLLAHEQAHFDITAIKACELAQAIRKAAFTKDNYLTLFDQLQKKYIGESFEEQNTYDNETSHGTIPDKQQEWQKKIAEQVRTMGCY